MNRPRAFFQLAGIESMMSNLGDTQVMLESR